MNSFHTQAYRYNLSVLQQFGVGNFPLEKYIVNVEKHMSPPSYLANHSEYSISNGLPVSDPEAKKITINDVMNSENWPPCDNFHLDESQYAAFQAALTNQFTVIQGPPGNLK